MPEKYGAEKASSEEMMTDEKKKELLNQQIIDRAAEVIEDFDSVDDMTKYLDDQFEEKLKAGEKFTAWDSTHEYTSEELAPGTEMRYILSGQANLLLIRKECETLCRHSLAAGADNILLMDRSARGYGMILHKILPLFRLEYAKIRGVDPKDIKVPEIHFANPRNGEIPDSEEIRAIIDDKKTIVFDESSGSGMWQNASNPIRLSPMQQYDYFDLSISDANSLNVVSNRLQTHLDVNSDEAAVEGINGGTESVWSWTEEYYRKAEPAREEKPTWYEQREITDKYSWLQFFHKKAYQEVMENQQKQKAGEPIVTTSDGSFTKQERDRWRKSQEVLYSPTLETKYGDYNATRFYVAKNLVDRMPSARIETHLGMSGTQGGQLTRLMITLDNYFRYIKDEEGSSFVTRNEEEVTPEKMRKLRQIQAMISKAIVEDVAKESFPELDQN